VTKHLYNMVRKYLWCASLGFLSGEIKHWIHICLLHAYYSSSSHSSRGTLVTVLVLDLYEKSVVHCQLHCHSASVRIATQTQKYFLTNLPPLLN